MDQRTGPSQSCMETKNLAALYDVPAMSWDKVRARLDAGLDQLPGSSGPGRHTTWLTTLNADGSPHVNALGALWDGGAFWFVSGRRSRKARNVERDPRCAVALSVQEFDLVLEGRASLVTDSDTLARLARRWQAEGWPCEVDATGSAITAPYSAQSAGPAPWHVYRVDLDSAHAVETVEPHGATRWRM